MNCLISLDLFSLYFPYLDVGEISFCFIATSLQLSFYNTDKLNCEIQLVEVLCKSLEPPVISLPRSSQTFFFLIYLKCS